MLMEKMVVVPPPIETKNIVKPQKLIFPKVRRRFECGHSKGGSGEMGIIGQSDSAVAPTGTKEYGDDEQQERVCQDGGFDNSTGIL